MLTVKRVQEYRIGIFKFAIFNHYITRRVSYIRSEIAIILEYGVHIMTAGFIRHKSVLFLLVGKLPAVTEACGGDCTAVFDKYVGATESECGASTVKDTISYNYIFIIKARDSIVTRKKFAILYENIIAGANVKAVVTAVNGDIFCGNI